MGSIDQPRKAIDKTVFKSFPWLVNRTPVAKNIIISLYSVSENILCDECLKAALRRAFYACVYCMQLRFQRSYLGWLKPR